MIAYVVVIIERLMCDMEVDLAAVAETPGLAADTDYSDELALLRPFEKNGSVLIDRHRIRITEKGRPYMRLVASTFDSYLKRANARHSIAV